MPQVVKADSANTNTGKSAIFSSDVISNATFEGELDKFLGSRIDFPGY